MTLTEYKKYINRDVAIIVFSTPGCSPCMQYGKHLNSIETSIGYPILKLNTYENAEVVAHLRISLVPATLIYKRGELVTRRTGTLTTEFIQAHINK